MARGPAAQALRRIRLARRQQQVTALVGGLGMNYRDVGARLEIRPSSVRHLAREVVELTGSSQPPREVLARVFLAQRAELEPLAATLDER